MSEPDPSDEEFLLHTNYSRDNFKLLNSNNNNDEESTKRIAVFEHKNRRYVRVYDLIEGYYYRCVECYSQKHEVKAKLSPDGQIFKVFEPFSHLCSPMRYLDAVMTANAPKNEQPDSALPSSSSSEEEEIEVPVRKKRRYTKTNLPKIDDEEAWITLDSTKFEYGCSARRIAKSRLIVFESDKKDKVQIYGIECNKRHYKCLKCNEAKAYVSEDTVKVLPNHSCPLKSYAKAKAEQEKITKLRIVQPEEFEYGMNQKHEAKKRLIIFEPKNKKFVREYGYNITNAAFVCLGCHPKFVSAKVFKDENGRECVEASNAHRCKPRLYKGIKAEQNSMKKARENHQIFKGDDFEFLLNERGAAKGRLIIFPTKDQVYAYYRQANNCYVCIRCNRDPHNIRMPAIVTKDENGNECVKATMSHVCQMVDYEEILEGQKKIKERHGLE